MKLVEANRVLAAETRMQHRMKSRAAQWWAANFNDEYIARKALYDDSKKQLFEAAAHISPQVAPVVQLKSLRLIPSPDQPTPAG